MFETIWSWLKAIGRHFSHLYEPTPGGPEPDPITPPVPPVVPVDPNEPPESPVDMGGQSTGTGPSTAVDVQSTDINDVLDDDGNPR